MTTHPAQDSKDRERSGEMMSISLAPVGPELVLAVPVALPTSSYGRFFARVAEDDRGGFRGIPNGGTLTALLSAELDIDVDTPSQRLEMLERMREQARALPGEGACGSTGTCRGCASGDGAEICRKEKSFLVVTPKGVVFTSRGPRRVCPGRQNDALNDRIGT